MWSHHVDHQKQKVVVQEQKLNVVSISKRERISLYNMFHVEIKASSGIPESEREREREYNARANCCYCLGKELVQSTARVSQYQNCIHVSAKNPKTLQKKEQKLLKKAPYHSFLLSPSLHPVKRPFPLINQTPLI